MTSFDPIERKTIHEFKAGAMGSPEWEESSLGYLRPSAPITKGRFARQLIEHLATRADVPVASVPGRRGNRCMIGEATCEIKFSMEAPARFQQVRPPTDGYDYLIGICAQPAIFRYWLIPAHDVTQLFKDKKITFQHAETSRWFRAELAQDDAFSKFRFAGKGFVEALAQLRSG